MAATVLTMKNPARALRDDQLVPFNDEAEMSVIGSIGLDGQALVDVVVSLRPDHFHQAYHRAAYAAAVKLYQRGTPTDFVTWVDELERHAPAGPAEGWASWLTGCIANTPTALYIRHYAAIIERTALQRGLITAAGRLSELAYTVDEVDALVDQAQQLIYSATERARDAGLRPISDGVNRVTDMMNSAAPIGSSTGYTDLDRVSGPLAGGKLYVIGGRPGAGKTALMLNIAQHVVERGGKALIYSLEMTQEEIVNRFACLLTGLDLHRVGNRELTDDEWPRYYQALARIHDRWRVEIDDSGTVTAADIRARTRRAHAQGPVDLVIVDYIQRMCRDENNRVAAIGQISRALKELAMELKIPVMAASQLSRAVELRPGRRPVLSDLRESGDIEADADLVMLAYRERYYNPDAPDYTAEINVAKHRNGRTGMVKLYFHEQSTAFKPLARGEE